MIWRNPLAWIGLGALLVPIAVHLLVRMHARPVPFPSLRFLQTSRLAAVRRRALSDWPLLALRLGIIALAVAALADPFFLNASRRAAWANRTTRVIIVDTTSSVDAAAARETAAREQASAFAAKTIDTADVRAGVTQGAAWLRSAAPAAREIVVVSDFQRDSVSESMLSALPAYVGVRFVRVGKPAQERTVDGRPATAPVANGRFAMRTPHVTVERDRTQTRWTLVTGTSGSTPATANAGSANAPFTIESTPAGFAVDAIGLRVQTSDADRSATRAAIEAVLSEGVPVSRRAGRAVVIAIGDGARTLTTTKDGDPGPLAPLAAPWMAEALNVVAKDRLLSELAAASQPASNGSAAAALVILRAADGSPLVIAGSTRARDAAQAPEAENALVLLSRAPVSSDVTPLLIRAALRAIADPDPLPEAEVAAISDTRLDAWRRPAALPPIEELTQVETTDRRWFWGAALALLAVETWLRRRMRRQEPSTQQEVAHAA